MLAARARALDKFHAIANVFRVWLAESKLSGDISEYWEHLFDLEMINRRSSGLSQAQSTN